MISGGDPYRYTPGTTPGNVQQQANKEAYDRMQSQTKTLSGQYIRDNIKRVGGFHSANKSDNKRVHHPNVEVNSAVFRFISAIILFLIGAILLAYKFS